MQVAPSVALNDVGDTDLILVPAPGLDVAAALRANAGTVEWLKERGQDPKLCFAGVCTGVALLADAGLLEGRTATTHWALLDHCKRTYPGVHWEADRLLTRDGNIYCSGGVCASIDLSLHLVERYCGHEVAVQTAKAEMPRSSQAVYRATPVRPQLEDAEVEKAHAWLAEHFCEDVQLDELAGHVGMNSRNFARRFKAALGEAPLAYVHRLLFRRLFQRHLGVSPRDCRARFGPRPLPSMK